MVVVDSETAGEEVAASVRMNNHSYLMRATMPFATGPERELSFVGSKLQADATARYHFE